MALLDFDGDYGRTYNARIRRLIPAYDAIFELAAATAAALQPQAQRVLVVGAGTGTELPALLEALPQATFTLVEPSEQMRGFCSDLLAGIGATARVVWGPDHLGAAAHRAFEVVISHNVLHVLAPAAQEQLLRQMAAHVAPGGCLLLSSYSESGPPGLDLGLAIGRTRFAALDTRHYTLELPRPLIQIDEDPREIGLEYPCEFSVVGDLKASLGALIENIEQRQNNWKQLLQGF